VPPGLGVAAASGLPRSRFQGPLHMRRKSCNSWKIATGLIGFATFSAAACHFYFHINVLEVAGQSPLPVAPPVWSHKSGVGAGGSVAVGIAEQGRGSQAKEESEPSEESRQGGVTGFEQENAAEPSAADEKAGEFAGVGGGEEARGSDRSTVGTEGDAGSPEQSLELHESPTKQLLKVYRQLCAWGCNGAGGVKRLSSEQRNTISSLYTPLIGMDPPAPILGERPGGPLTAEHAQCTASKLFTGRKRPEGPRVLVDVFTGMGGGAELDLLELRLHELDGVVDVFVVTESHFGNHGDRKPLHFERRKERFKHFLPKILHVVTDKCKKYMEAAEDVQSDTKRGTKGVWNLQGIQRGCAVDALVAERAWLPEDALVILSDLDEIPNGRAMNDLKHCEIRQDATWPLHLTMRVIPFNLRTGCPKKRDRYNKGTVSLWKKFKKGKMTVWPSPKSTGIPDSGVHLTSMGSLAQVSYKLLNHGESAQIAPLVMPGDKDIKTCDVKDEQTVREMQRWLSEKPVSVLRHWEKAKNVKKRPLPPADAKELAECALPWPLLTSPARYPFLWGAGSLD